jgi:glucan endo-1,3-alpha-glucosidase
VYISQLCKTRLLTASCALLLLSGGALSHAQTAGSIDYLYVSPQGSDSWSGQYPTPNADSGPFQTLERAQGAVTGLTEAGLVQPVEVIVDPGVCNDQDFLNRWFGSRPNTPVIWHSDPNRTILIYTHTMDEQIDALSAEDYSDASAGGTTRFYVSSAGNDSWSGHFPSKDADNGPFQSVIRAQDAVNAFQAKNPNAPVEVVFEKDASGKNAADAPRAMKAVIAPPAKKQVLPTEIATILNLKIVPTKAVAVKSDPLSEISQSPKLVFAHYMVCNRDYGGSVAGYERDIKEAQAAGIDGFVLNCGSWSNEVYQVNTASMFQAAQTLSPDGSFKLFFSADMTGLTFPEVVQMMTAYSAYPNYWHVQQVVSPTVTLSRPVLSTWGGEGGGWAAAKGSWQNSVLTPLRAAGINPYFLPGFFITSPDGKQYLDNTPTTVAPEISGLLAGLADGAFYGNSVGCPTDPSHSMETNNEGYAALLKTAGLSGMACVSPQYWGDRQISAGRRYFEYTGGEGIEAQWNSIIKTQKPQWVECFTWNDFDEATYFSPIDDVTKYWPYTQHTTPDFYKSHTGALKLNQYYINWYKSGVQPAVTADSLYYFYRTQPKAAVASNDSLGPVTWLIGDVEDTIYVTTILTAPATLVVTTGTQTLTYPVPAGIGNTRVPFQTGAQSFQLIRHGKTIVSQAGEPIIASPTEYNYNYYTGVATD